MEPGQPPAPTPDGRRSNFPRLCPSIIGCIQSLRRGPEPMRPNLGLLAAPESTSMQPDVHRHRLDKGPSVNIVFPMRDFRKPLSAPPMPTSHARPGLRRRLENAFTLLEILVVLLILGLLAGLAITNLDKIFGGAQVQTAELFVSQTMKLPLNAYRISMGDYPTT